MIDILYIYKHSQNSDQELKYSLRSLGKYVPDVGRVFITGECPNFIDKNKVIFTPCNDCYAPMSTHWNKVQTTTLEAKIGINFALMYDDIFFVKTTHLTNYPHYQRGLLGEDKNGGEHYRQTLLNAKETLEKEGYNTFDYELHTPFVYNTTNFWALNNTFKPLINDAQSMAVRSVYGNMFCKESPYRGDIKIRDKSTKVKDVIGTADCFSCSDEAFNGYVLEFLESEFPKKSKWEV